MQIPEKFWKRLAVGVGVLVGVIVLLWAGLRLFAEGLRNAQMVFTNDTEAPLQIAAIVQSHDNNQLYVKTQKALEVGETVTIDSSVDSVRCILVSETSGVHFDVSLIDQPPLSSIITVTDSSNLFGGDVKSYNANLSELIATLATNECPYVGSGF